MEDFLTNPKVLVGGPAGRAATCLGEKGETLDYRVYLRRREICSDWSKDRRLDLGSREVRSSIQKVADGLAASDGEQLSELLEGSSGDDFRARWKEQMERYAGEFRCLKGVGIRMSMTYLSPSKQGQRLIDLNRFHPIPKAGFGQSQRQVSEAARKAFANPENPEVRELEEQYLKFRAERGLLCGKPVEPWITTTAGTVQYREAVIDLTAHFPGGRAVLSPEEKSKLRSAIEQKMLEQDSCRGKLVDVEIYASANKERNPETSGFEPWDFLSLSSERAEFTKGVLAEMKSSEDPRLQAIFGGLDLSRVKPRLGDGGSGASGPCPYKMVATSSQVDGQSVYAVRRDSSVTKESLGEHKKARVVLRFADQCFQATAGSGQGVFTGRSSCMMPQPYCKQ